MYEVIIPAAGQGKRMKAGKNKLFLELDGIPIIVYTLKIFEDDPLCRNIILAVNPDEEEVFRELAKTFAITKIKKYAKGGAERQQSVFNGLKETDRQTEVVMVHDGARPFVKKPFLKRLYEAAAAEGGAILAVPVKDTIKKASGQKVIETVERSSLWSVQTPQAFRVPALKRAHVQADKDGWLGTDDASLLERDGEQVVILESDYDNIKITTREDLYFAEAILNKLRAE